MSRAIVSSSALSDAMLPELLRRLCLPDILSGHDDFGSSPGSRSSRLEDVREEFAKNEKIRSDAAHA